MCPQVILSAIIPYNTCHAYNDIHMYHFLYDCLSKLCLLHIRYIYVVLLDYNGVVGGGIDLKKNSNNTHVGTIGNYLYIHKT